MVVKTNDESKKSIVQKCDSTHLIVYFLRAEKYYAPPGGSDYDFVIFAKCPITGTEYDTKRGNYIKGKVLHYVGNQSMSYKLINCTPSDFNAKYESWDEIAEIIANHQGIEEMDSLKELMAENFPNANFANIVLENNKVKKKTLKKGLTI